MDPIFVNETESQRVLRYRAESENRKNGERSIKAYKKSVKKQMKADKANTDAIIDAVNSNAQVLANGFEALGEIQEKGFRTLQDRLERTQGAIERLNEDFNWKMDGLILQQMVQNQQLDKLLVEVRKAEFEREARAYRERAESFLLKGLWEEALEEFEKSLARNKVDYLAQMAAGILHLNMPNVEAAREHFQLAIKYSKAYKADKYQALSQLYLATTYYLQCKEQKALSEVKLALESDPNLHQAYYDMAKYQVLIGEVSEGMKNLKIAIQRNPLYSVEVVTDLDFAHVSKELNQLLSDLHQEAKDAAQGRLGQFLEAIGVYEGISSYDFSGIKQEAESLGIEGNYFELLAFPAKLEELIKPLLSNLRTFIDNRQGNVEPRKSEWPTLYHSIQDLKALLREGDFTQSSTARAFEKSLQVQNGMFTNFQELERELNLGPENMASWEVDGKILFMEEIRTIFFGIDVHAKIILSEHRLFFILINKVKRDKDGITRSVYDDLLTTSWTVSNMRSISISGKKNDFTINKSDAVYPGSPHMHETLVGHLKRLNPGLDIGKGNCFIATACCEPTEVHKLELLRWYRDNRLAKQRLGRWFIQAYYFTSPPFARLISRSERMKKLTKTVLINPLVSKVKRIGTRT